MKAKAAAIMDREERAPSWVPDYARGDAELWTPKLVKIASLDAFRMIGRAVGRVTPRADPAFWPEFQNNPDDYADGEAQERWAERRPKYEMRMTIERMNMVFGLRTPPGPADNWFAGPLLAVPEYRRKLLEWIRAELRGRNFTEVCRRRKWVYTTACSQRDRAAAIIARRLNTAGEEVW